MKFKLDENLGSRTAHVLRAAGHNVETVLDEALSGATDDLIFAKCAAEKRCLITLDLDFADVVRFPPHTSAGIAVLRLPKGASPALLERFGRDLLSGLDVEPIAGRLWIVEPGRIRVHEQTRSDTGKPESL